MTPFQKALSDLSETEAKAVFEALDQFVENSSSEMELVKEGQKPLTPDFVEVFEAGEGLLDRCNTELAKLAEPEVVDKMLNCSGCDRPVGVAGAVERVWCPYCA